ncbi:SAM-dependent methyltransferase [Actinoplanes auranticolor]|uniref:S-adenosyl methyltransferase n=1 Tax=Actinoplanes auranticolor TaxID=47988 RepID=A0A919VJ01_9ACTN|nr:SAM-dependent methyltransferase [Actinoplanes auranticolor]GIM64615.1 hypothetical protein Aau02nite_11600 [Actinoplanes auranticolor]
MAHPASGPPNPAGSTAEHQREVEHHVACVGGDPLDFSRPSPARRYDELQGGKDNLAADRQSAARLQEALPSIRLAAAELRRCLERQVAYLAQRGVRQFLDIGCGLPHEPNVHEIVQSIDPSCRIVYVDSDELVGAHARALLVGDPQGVTEFVAGDLTDIDPVLEDKTTRDVLDFDQPIAVLLLAVLHFVVDDRQAYAAVNRIKTVLAPGSYVALTHVTFDPLEPDTAARLAAMAASMEHGPFKARTRSDVAAFLDGLALIEPGLVSTVDWHPDRDPQPQATAELAVAYAAIGRLP